MNDSDEQWFVELVSDFLRDRTTSFPRLLAVTKQQRPDNLGAVLGFTREQDCRVYDQLCQRLNDNHLTKEDLRHWRMRIRNAQVTAKHAFDYAIGFVVVGTVLVNVFAVFGLPKVLNGFVVLALGVMAFLEIQHAWAARGFHTTLESMDQILAAVLENFASINRDPESK